MKPTLLVALLALATPAVAQINPYQAPAPGWVFVQPCGQEPGWVPPTHPLASSPTRFCQPAPEPLSVAQPWEVAPQLPFEIGHAYRDPYGLVIHVIGATVAYRYNPTTGLVDTVVEHVEAMEYQSQALYRRRERGWPVYVDLTKPRAGWWELP